MKKNIFTIAIAAMALMLTGACTLHQEPERTDDGELGVDPTRVTIEAELNLNIDLPGTDQTVFPVPDTVMHRFIVEAYNRDREVVARQVFYDKDIASTSFNIPVRMQLHANRYRIVVWSDYVRVSDPEAQLFYNASSLTPVINNGNYRGNNDAKDSFSGYTDIDLFSYADQWSAKVDVQVNLERPMGRYEVIATDVEAFKRRIADGVINGTRFTARIKYAGYLAVGYNCYDQIRKHSLNYMQYTRTLGLNSEDPTMLLGFDYLFVAPDESLDVPVEIEIVNENNLTVSRSAVTIPLALNKNVIVRGRFLTSTADGGLNIDPGYDGDVTIDIGTLNPTR